MVKRLSLMFTLSGHKTIRTAYPVVRTGRHVARGKRGRDGRTDGRRGGADSASAGRAAQSLPQYTQGETKDGREKRDFSCDRPWFALPCDAGTVPPMRKD